MENLSDWEKKNTFLVEDKEWQLFTIWKNRKNLPWQRRTCAIQGIFPFGVCADFETSSTLGAFQKWTDYQRKCRFLSSVTHVGFDNVFIWKSLCLVRNCSDTNQISYEQMLFITIEVHVRSHRKKKTSFILRCKWVCIADEIVMKFFIQQWNLVYDGPRNLQYDLNYRPRSNNRNKAGLSAVNLYNPIKKQYHGYKHFLFLKYTTAPAA